MKKINMNLCVILTFIINLYIIHINFTKLKIYINIKYKYFLTRLKQ